MRLIDADALIKKLQNHIDINRKYWSCDAHIAVLNIIDVIKAEPAMDERKHGRWENGTCSVCGEYAATDVYGGGIEESAQTYCWNCGARMDGKE